jgi:hypothetical protein
MNRRFGLTAMRPFSQDQRECMHFVAPLSVVTRWTLATKKIMNQE